MIGIYGGTFDPIHYGHLRTALEVKEIFALDEVRLIPCKRPAHRDIPSTSADMRFEMLQLSVKNQPELVVDRRELDRAGVSYMIDTVKSLQADFPGNSLLLFMGTDAFKGLQGWHQWQQLFDYVHVVVMTRPGYQSQLSNDFLSGRVTDDKDNLFAAQAGYLYFQSVTQLDISASCIRHAVETGLNPGFLLPDSVIDYINKNNLYIG